MKIFKALENSGVLITKPSALLNPLEIKQKNPQEDFLVDSLDILGVSSLGNMTSDKDTIRASNDVIQAGDGVIRAW